jgi:hypothetical protein
MIDRIPANLEAIAKAIFEAEQLGSHWADALPQHRDLARSKRSRL